MELNREALIRDLATVLAGASQPPAVIGSPGRVALRRMQEVLGWADGESHKGIEELLTAALADAATEHDASAPVRYYRVMSGTYAVGNGGFSTITYAGVIDVPAGTTRADVFEKDYRKMCRQARRKPNVVFFSLEPNELGGA